MTLLQVRLSGTVATEIDGTELRGVRGLAFAVPVTAGTYRLTVVARDTRGCQVETPATRSVVVQ